MLNVSGMAEDDESPNTQVIISGAGPVGLALGLGLARLGVRSVILERREVPTQHCRAPGILTRTLEILAQWHVLERFLSEGKFVQDLQPRAAGETEPTFTLPFGRILRAQTPYPGALLLPQNRTEALLAQAAEATGLCDIRRGHGLESFEETPVGVRVEVRPNEGAAYTLRGAYLAGCDGARSTVRRALGIAFVGKTYPSRFLLADFTVDDARDAQPMPRYCTDGGRFTMAVRIAPHLWRLVAVVPSSMPDAQALDPAALQQRGEQLLGPGALRCAWAEVFHIHCRVASAFHRGRVVLAGDAAHINSPVGGQGMNSGIQDANNLAWKLASAVGKDGDLNVLLRSYECERREVVRHDVSRYTDVLTRMVVSPLLRATPVRALVGALLKRLMASDAFLRWLIPRMTMLPTRYATSPLLVGHHPLLGARAPNALLRNDAGQLVRLFDDARGRALLVLFEGGPSIQPLMIAQRGIKGLRNVTLVRVASEFGPGGPDVLRDSDKEMWKHWHAKDGMLALIRPDGHVGWVSQHTPHTPSEVRINVRHALGMRPSRVVYPHSRGRVRTDAAARLFRTSDDAEADDLPLDGSEGTRTHAPSRQA